MRRLCLTLLRVWRARRATSALEVALTLPVFLTALLGVFEVARYLAMQQSLTEATYAAGRYAVVHGAKSSSPATTASITASVQAHARLLVPSSLSVSATFSPDNSPGSTVKIVSTYPFASAAELIGFPSVTLKATSAATILY